MAIKRINPISIYDGAPSGMSQATIDTDTGLVFISGQVDWENSLTVNRGNIAEQTRIAALHLITVLKESGSSVSNILQLRVYVRGEVEEQLETIIPIISGTLGGARPALTGIGVTSLVSPDTLIEIEAVAKVK
jgi:enamine deaminase RidA (YjgF/YER057c/UK114 family)